jgi:hypothetical protein
MFEASEHLEDLGVDARVTLKYILKMGWESIDWIKLAEDKEQWPVLGTTVMNLWAP